MAPVYADHPFRLVTTPSSLLPKGTEPTLFHHNADGMALTHNIVARGLNAIYLQAPHIKPSDVPAFCNFILCWHSLISQHHDGEEEDYFPAIEAMAGEPGIMKVNVEQHAAFHDGLVALAEYVKGRLEGKGDYSGEEVRRLIDVFAEAMMVHLEEEIPTILALERFGAEKMKELSEVSARAAQKDMDIGFTTGLPWIFAHIDRGFEGGRWENWPPIPEEFLNAIKGAYEVHADWWKFSAVDRDGKMQPLYAIPKGES